MKNTFKKLLVVAMITASTQASHGLSIAFGLASSHPDISSLKDEQYNGFIGAGALFFAIIDPSWVLGWLLDEPTTAVTKMSQSIINHGAHPKEAKNLAILLVNASRAEAQSGKAVIITRQQILAAAPDFSKTRNFEIMLNSMVQK